MIEKEKLVGFDKHEYAPMIREKTAQMLTMLLQEKQPKKVLEIGTFLGYSAGLILQACPSARLVTVEKNEQNAADAKENLKKAGVLDRCEVVCSDAIDFLQANSEEKFDFVFLDGAKGQYYKYLPFLKSMLTSGGVLFADDILYYGLVLSEEKVQHKHRSIVNNLRKFLQILTEDEDFQTQIFQIEDGVSVSVKK